MSLHPCEAAVHHTNDVGDGNGRPEGLRWVQVRDASDWPKLDISNLPSV